MKKLASSLLSSSAAILALTHASLLFAAENVNLLVWMKQGVPQLQISGPNGAWVLLQGRPTLARPALWETLTVLQLGTTSSLFLDTQPAAGAARYYQIRSPLASPSDPAEFLMGSAADEQDRDVDEGPQTAVTLTHPYWIAQHEVTQAEYNAVIGSNPSAFTGDALLPVEQVTWTEAQTYCAKLTQRDLASGLIPQGVQYRLPTEAEWELAARAGTTTRFFFGNDPNYSELAAYGWFALNSNASTHPVAQKLPNDAGLFDINGNVSEWCQDWYATYPGGSVLDPNGPATGVQRVVRGGSYYYDGWLARSASRNAFPPNTRKRDVGFRWVLSTQ